MPPELDAEMLATLTPEERAAIEDDKPSAEELAAMQRIAANAPQDDDDDDDDDDTDKSAGDDKPAEAAKPVDDKGAAADAAATAAAADDVAKTVTEVKADATTGDTFVPRYESKLPSDFEDKVKSLDEQEQSVWSKFDGGEIDRAVLQQELRQLELQRQDLNSARIKSEISQEMQAQTAEQQWVKTVSRFMANVAKPEEGGIDYRKDETKAADLDQFVKVLAQNQANSEKSMEWFLQEAHKRVQALHGVTTPTKQTDTVEDAKARRKPPIDSAPKTLAQVPGSDGPGDVAGEFADLDALEGNDLESAIAKMSPAQRERYARA